MKKKYLLIAIGIIASFGFIKYPIDGYKKTGIARLYQLRKMQIDSVRYTRIPAGAYKKLEDIKLNLTNKSKDTITEVYKKKNVINGKVMYSKNDRLDTNNILKFY